MDDMTDGDAIRPALARRSGRGPLEDILRRLLGSPGDEYRRHADDVRRRTNWERGIDPHKTGEESLDPHKPGERGFRR
jgi:hypothetical protein